MICPKCKSENVLVQQVQTGNVGVKTTPVGKKHHGIFWWLLIGWWYKFLKLIIIGPINLLLKRDKIKTTEANKALFKTMATCQNCGHSWKV